MSTKLRPRSRDAGFSLIELLVSMGIMLVVMGGVFTVLTDAYRAAESASSLIGLNNNLRIGVDLIVRDLIQVGQGLPTGRTIQVPNGAGALPIQRPGPRAARAPTWPAGTAAIPAVTPGPGCGPLVNGVADRHGDHARRRLGAGRRARAELRPGGAQRPRSPRPRRPRTASTSATAGADDVRVGDLLMFTKGSVSALVYVTGVDGGQTITLRARAIR